MIVLGIEGAAQPALAQEAELVQAASSILPPAWSASANWRKAGMLSVGGIPNRTAVCGATLSPRGGGKDDTANIQEAIEKCPAGQVLQLAAGTFTINEGEYIQLDQGITIRGSGTCNRSISPYCSTVITVHNGAVLGQYVCGQATCNWSPAILVSPSRWGVTWTPTTLTADAAQGATSVHVANRTAFAVGQWVLLDEASGASWQTDPEHYGKVWAAPDWASAASGPATGRVMWQKHNPSQSFDDFASNEYPYTPNSTGCYYSFCDRPTSELHLITGIAAGAGETATITFDSPLTIAYRESGNHKAQLYYPSQPFIQHAGVENLTIEHSDQGAVVFQDCAYCWAKNVEATVFLNGAFDMNYAARVELNQVYDHTCAWPVNGGGGYTIDLQNATTEIYVVNSISVQCNKVITIRSGGAGTVVAYNYMDDQFISGSDSWQEIGINGSHAAGSHHTLFEGNYGSNLDSDHTHGNAVYHTYFRNLATGNRARFTDYLNKTIVDDVNNLPGGNGPLRAAGVMGYTYWMAFIGNVLGISGHTAAWNGWVYESNFANGSPGIWLLGWNEQPPYNSDPNSTTRTIRDGNFDYLTNSIHWASNDTAHTLPNSLYLTQKPAFFDADTWPWVVPTGAGLQLYKLPAKERYDAGTPFTQP
jgi:hypothetical protein